MWPSLKKRLGNFKKHLHAPDCPRPMKLDSLRGPGSPMPWLGGVCFCFKCLEFLKNKRFYLFISAVLCCMWDPSSPTWDRTCAPAVEVCVLLAQLYPTLCDPVDCSPPDSSVHGIFQTRILEWVAISSSRGSS